MVQNKNSRLPNLLSNNLKADHREHMKKPSNLRNSDKSVYSISAASSKEKILKSRERREVRFLSKNLNLGKGAQDQFSESQTETLSNIESKIADLKSAPKEGPALHPHRNKFLSAIGQRDPVISRLLQSSKREVNQQNILSLEEDDDFLGRLSAKNSHLAGSGAGDLEKVIVITSTEPSDFETQTDGFKMQQFSIDDSIDGFKDYNSESHDYNNFLSYENDDYDDYYDYLLNSLNDDLSSEDLEMNDDDEDLTVYRDFPIGTGYVSIPIQAPELGLNIPFFQHPPSLQLWTAEEAFKQQVIPTLYMLVPAALLGFIIGMSIWLIVLIILRTYTSIRKSLETRKDGPEDDLIKNLNYTLSKDPWKKISDAETVHGLDGSTKKRDRIWHLRQEGRRGIGGSDRKPRPIRRDDSRVSSLSAGKDMKF